MERAGHKQSEKQKETGRTLKDWLSLGTELLASSGIEEAESDARILLEYAAEISRSYYYLHMSEPVGEREAGLYARLLRQRAEREPVQYITGRASFCGNEFFVTKEVLIPRQDTEILVEEAKKVLMPGMKVLDLCTGSGCVLLSLLNGCAAEGTGSDISREALAVAERNREKLGLCASWIKSDLFGQITDTFDMIVSNPPYIASGIIQELDPEVRDHEPHLALDGGPEGMDLISRIIREAPGHLDEGGRLLLEIGYDQGDRVLELLRRYGYEDAKIIRDLADKDRVASGRRPESCRSLLKN